MLAIRTLLNTSTLMVADLTGWLKAAEESLEGPPAMLHHDGKLYLTQDEWNRQQMLRVMGRTQGAAAQAEAVAPHVTAAAQSADEAKGEEALEARYRLLGRAAPPTKSARISADVVVSLVIGLMSVLPGPKRSKRMWSRLRRRPL